MPPGNTLRFTAAAPITKGSSVEIAGDMTVQPADETSTKHIRRSAGFEGGPLSAVLRSHAANTVSM